MDLALVQFNSSQTYAIAEIGDSDSAIAGSSIHISGWPHPGQAITSRIFQMTSGKVSGRALGAAEDGYDLVYTNVTRSGMSGGPIFNEQARLIGIHGRAEGAEIYDPDTGNTVAVKAGFNLGIPIATFIELTEPSSLPPNPTFAYGLSMLGDRH